MNSKKLAILVIVGLLVVGAGGAGFYWMKMNEPSFKGLAIPVRGMDEKFPKLWEEAFQKVINEDDELMKKVVAESNYASRMGIAEGEAVAHLRKAARADLKRTTQTINVGIMGIRKQNDDLAEISSVLYRELEAAVAEREPSFYQYLEMRAESLKNR